MKSVIVEIRGKYAAALSEDGSIIKVRNNGYEVGQQIDTGMTFHAIPQRFIAIAACIALLLISGLGAYTYFTPYSYVSLDVNPSVEFILNRFDCVLSVEGVNDDGQAIVENIELSKLRNRHIDYAVVHTVSEISKHGYLEGPGISGIVIATSANNSRKAEKLAAELKEAVEQELLREVDPVHDDPESKDTETSPQCSQDPNNGSGGKKEKGPKSGPSSETAPSSAPSHSADNSKGNSRGKNDNDKNDPSKAGKPRKSKVIVESFNVSKEVVDKAKEKGTTPGKLQLVERLQESAKSIEDIDIESWLDKPVRDIMKATHKYQIERNDDDDRSEKGSAVGPKDEGKAKKDSLPGTNGKNDNKNTKKSPDPSGKSGNAGKGNNPAKQENGKNNAGKQSTGNFPSDNGSRDPHTGKDESQSNRNNDKAGPSGKKNGKGDVEKGSKSGPGSKSGSEKDNGKSRENNDGQKKQDSKKESKNNTGNKKAGNKGISSDSKTKTGNSNNNIKNNSNNKGYDKNRNNGVNKNISSNSKWPTNQGMRP